MTIFNPHLPRFPARPVATAVLIVLVPVILLVTLLVGDRRAGADDAGAEPRAARLIPSGITLPTVPAPNAARTEPSLASACPAPAATFVDSWGAARSGGRRHKGVDMMAAHGTPVLAPQDGWVREHSSALGGLSYYLTTPDGTEYFGGHLQTFISDGIQDGFGWVTAGTLIGTVGSSGNASSSGPHLHWEVRTPDGTSVNPYPFAALFCAP
jgi:murein DD-endopeptidase MepM/ murein hydrolase activator NlpD